MKTRMHFNAGPSVFYHARILRKNPTPAEEKLWNYLRNNQMKCKFRRQHPFNSYVLDFYCHYYKLVIEVDGGVHEDGSVKIIDMEKEAFIRAAGLHIIRFSNEQVMFEISHVLDTIHDKIAELKSSMYQH